MLLFLMVYISIRRIILFYRIIKIRILEIKLNFFKNNISIIMLYLILERGMVCFYFLENDV